MPCAAGFLHFWRPPLCRYAVAVLITTGRLSLRMTAITLSALSIPVLLALLLLVFASRAALSLSETTGNADDEQI